MYILYIIDIMYVLAYNKNVLVVNKTKRIN